MKFLIIRFSSIGDIVLTTPIIRCIKSQIEDSEIHYLTKATYSNILVNNPYIDKLYLLEDSMSETINGLKQEKYDYIIDLHRNIRTWRVKRSLNIKSFTFNKLNWEKWLIVNFKINRLPAKHIVDRYFDAVTKLGIINDGKGLDYFINEDDTKSTSEFLINIDNKFIAIGLGGTYYTKRFPSEKLISLCREINNPIILLGGKEEFQYAEEIVREAGSNIHNLCGKLTINKTASILKSADMVITNDTGVMHIAAAYKKEIISIWGNTIPEFGMYPYFGSDNSLYQSNSHIMEVKGLRCRPCSKLGYKKCPKGHFKC